MNEVEIVIRQVVCGKSRIDGTSHSNLFSFLSFIETLTICLSEASPLTNTTFPHVVPLITLLERNLATTENIEPWEISDSGVEVVMSHLEAARTIAHHGGLYKTNAELKLQGKYLEYSLLLKQGVIFSIHQ